VNYTIEQHSIGRWLVWRGQWGQWRDAVVVADCTSELAAQAAFRLLSGNAAPS
jgi:hypothetical protein